MNKKIEFNYQEHTDVSTFSKSEKEVIQAAIDSVDNAYAPYSGFHVGAAVLLANDKIVIGSNQENVAYPSGLCAERVAVFAASSQYPGIEIKMMAISAKSILYDFQKPVTPCGACRQVLSEYETLQKTPILLFLVGRNGTIYKIDNVNSLLPLLFFEEQLKK